ncbi:MAG: hypothetical protein IJ682_04790 [Lachnospiraceae bacterium]|nr:hypothetical protein [Lachnospiraceae bacterium]
MTVFSAGVLLDDELLLFDELLLLDELLPELLLPEELFSVVCVISSPEISPTTSLLLEVAADTVMTRQGVAVRPEANEKIKTAESSFFDSRFVCFII